MDKDGDDDEKLEVAGKTVEVVGKSLWEWGLLVVVVVVVRPITGGSWLLLCNTSLLTNLCKLVCSTPLLLPSSLQTLASYKEQSRVGDVNDSGDHDYGYDYAF